MTRSSLKFILFFVASIFLILIDQLTKHLAYKYLYNKKPIVLIKDIIEFVYVENRGAAFGILQNKQSFFYLLTIVVFIIIFYAIYSLKLNANNLSYFMFLILIFAGAFGNFIDRLKNKYVIDFIYFKLIDFPVFNFADICITLGCVLLVFSLIFVYRGEEI